MTENEIKKATIEDAIYCAKAMACLEVCEECRFYGLCHTWCDDTYRIMHEALEEVKAYRAIGTIDEFKALKEKNEPKKIDIWANGEEHCPFCDKNLTTFYGFANCFSCGQKLDWQ